MDSEKMDRSPSFKYIRRIKGEFKAGGVTIPMLLLLDVENTFEFSNDESQWGGIKNQNSKAEFKEAILLDESLIDSLLQV